MHRNAYAIYTRFFNSNIPGLSCTIKPCHEDIKSTHEKGSRENIDHFSVDQLRVSYIAERPILLNCLVQTKLHPQDRCLPALCKSISTPE